MFEGSTLKYSYNTGEVSATSETDVAHSGGIVGRVRNSTIDSCYNEANITATTNSSLNAYAGGIAGCINNSTINNCKNKNTLKIITANTDASAHAGGIVGYAYKDSNYDNETIIKYCYNNQQIKGSSPYYAFVGGIIGKIESSTVENSYNTYTVTSTSTSLEFNAYAGGIAGIVSNCSIKSCYNTGAIKAKSKSSEGSSTQYYADAGGIAGYAHSNSTIQNCYNTGHISATIAGKTLAYVGGIVGYNENTDIRNCYNKGFLTYFADEGTLEYIYLGGIAGDVYNSTIVNCYNVGNVNANTNTSITGTLYIGGIVGRMQSSDSDSISDSIAYCYNKIYITASVFETVYMGGIAGYIINSIVKYSNNYSANDCYEANNAYVGGIVGY